MFFRRSAQPFRVHSELRPVNLRRASGGAVKRKRRTRSLEWNEGPLPLYKVRMLLAPTLLVLTDA